MVRGKTRTRSRDIKLTRKLQLLLIVIATKEYWILARRQRGRGHGRALTEVPCCSVALGKSF